MISYAGFWKIVEERNITTYALREKAHISSSTLSRMRENDSVSTNTLDSICCYLECTLSDIAEFIKDEST